MRTACSTWGVLFAGGLEAVGKAGFALRHITLPQKRASRVTRRSLRIHQVSPMAAHETALALDPYSWGPMTAAMVESASTPSAV